MALDGADDVRVVACGFCAFIMNFRHQIAHAVYAHEKQRHCHFRDFHAPAAEIIKEVLRGMGGSLKPAQADKAARALDRVHDAKNIAKQFLVVRLLLKFDQIEIEHGQALCRFFDKFRDEIVHGA